MPDNRKRKAQLVQELQEACERIAEMEQTKRDLSTFFEMSIDLACIADLNRATFIKINPAFQRTLGFSEAELLGRPFLEYIHPDDVQPTIDVIERQLKAGKNAQKIKNKRFHFFSLF